MSANVALLEQTMTYIEQNPDEWNQATWARCFAGHAVRISAEPFIPEFDGIDCDCESCDRVNFAEQAISHRARRALNLHAGQAGLLFYGKNDLTTLRRLVNLMISEAKTNVTKPENKITDARILVSA